ncbi:hypothetical protein ACH4PU_27135 [Streptomyces sp. NPDC021100]|uniref:hypothetical protein n=1 Tax=Streptomyces sp. NPDC021100 TaxID=3365114 RepID=UPI0037A141BA
MASTARTVLVPAAVAVALLAGLTACVSDSGSGSGKDDGPAKKTAQSAHLSWQGAALPGLAAKPAWTVPAAPGGTAVFAVGDAFAVVTAPGAEKTANDKGPALREGPKTVEFRDARDGAVRKTLKFGDAKVTADTWHGAPALRVRVTSTTPSDGMTSDKSTSVEEVYDGRGGKLGSAAQENATHFSDGWFAKDGTVARAGGGAANKLEKSGDLQGMHVPVRSQDLYRYSPEERTFAGDHAFSYEEVERGMFNHPERLVATDLATGKKAWTTSEAGRPSQALPEDKSHAVNVVPVTVVGDRIVLAWQTKGDEHAETEPWVMSVNDVDTGRLLATGPVVEAEAPGSRTDFGNPLTNPTFQVTYDASTGALVTSGRPGMGKPWLATAWDLKSGKRLWAQGPDENDFSPLTAGNGVVYGYTNPGTQGYWDPIAVDVKTKKVLAKKLDNDQVPVFGADGHGAVSVDKGVFVFPAA